MSQEQLPSSQRTQKSGNMRTCPLSRAFVFVPVAVETLGPICSVGEEFVTELGRRIANVSGDPRDTAFLFQRISIAVQRGNAAAVLVPLRLVSDSN